MICGSNIILFIQIKDRNTVDNTFISWVFQTTFVNIMFSYIPNIPKYKPKI